jgi:hypothetical protein
MGQGCSILAGIREEGFSFGEEMREADFGDQRLTDRLVVTLDQMSRHPSLPMTGACQTNAQVKGAYRLIENERVGMDKILSAHRGETVKRISDYERVFAVQDTTTLNYGTHLATQGLGQIGIGGGSKGRGLFLHSTEVFSPSGLPLGILDQLPWSREELAIELGRTPHPLAFTEKRRWILGLDQIGEAQKQLPNTEIVVLSDRESDFNDYLIKSKRNKIKVVIRAVSKIRKNEEKKLFTEVVEELEILNKFSLEIQQMKGPSRFSKRKGPHSKKDRVKDTRTAHLEVRAKKIVLRNTHNGLIATATEEEKTFWAVWVNEVDTPAEYEPIEWLLLTSEDLSENQKQKVFEVINWYKMRWGIEIFHKILKSGCRIESAQYDELERLKKFITLVSLVAWRLHRLVHLQREQPEAPCTELLTNREWEVLFFKIHQTKKIPAQPPTLRQATHWIARLGGFLDRKGDGEPGPLTLWRGWQRLMDLVDGYSFLPLNAPQSYG